jgi:hypothetical protein
MKEIEDIREMEEKLIAMKRSLRVKQENCIHEWSQVKYDPEKYKEFHVTHYVAHGSDPEPEGFYRDAEKDRWSRTCPKCGKVEYTYEKKPVKYEPAFK